MLLLNTPISALPKVGPKYKTLLGKLEIYTIEDLLYHFPFRYEDYSVVKNISDLISDEVVTVNGTLESVTNIFSKYGKRLTKAKLTDFSGDLDVIWFNQQYLKKMLKTGQEYTMSGKIQKFSNKLCLISPEIEEKSNSSINTGRLVPIYPETYGVSSKWLRSRINDVLSREVMYEEFLPQEILIDRNLKNIKTAFFNIHFPNNEIDADNARHRFAFEEIFIELLNVQKRKIDWNTKLNGFSLKPYESRVNEFINDLPFKLTESQVMAVEQIINDLKETHPMNRLLEGDVGTGKTVVAAISAYITYLNSLKTVYMAPTEILAFQHFKTFNDILSKFGVNVVLVTSSTKSKLKDNEIKNADVVVGTHAILFNKDIENTGLIVIDEQHKFGVEQRGKILELSKQTKAPHLLTMTATPIPRTLALTLYGDLSISNLKQRPEAKRNVVTKVVGESKRSEAYDWIKNKDEQIFIVCPLIEESESESLENVKAAESEFKALQTGVFKTKKMGLLHGRMKSSEKDAVVEKFRKGEINVLVSTPVIEVGLDIPDAAIIVIESAERYGLASLHQLRGRVGRTGKEGYCFLVTSSYSRQAYDRLKNLERVDNGLELSEIDMRLRGRGDIFGTMQHGYKKFKVAGFDELSMIEDVKELAVKYYAQIDKYPALNEKLTKRTGEYIKNN